MTTHMSVDSTWFHVGALNGEVYTHDAQPMPDFPSVCLTCGGGIYQRQPRQEDGLDVARLARVLHGIGYEGFIPVIRDNVKAPTDEQRRAAAAIAAEYARLAAEGSDEGSKP